MPPQPAHRTKRPPARTPSTTHIFLLFFLGGSSRSSRGRDLRRAERLGRSAPSSSRGARRGRSSSASSTRRLRGGGGGGTGGAALAGTEIVPPHCGQRVVRPAHSSFTIVLAAQS